jgi:archaellum component FlaC
MTTIESLLPVSFDGTELRAVIDYTWNFAQSSKKYKYVFKDNELVLPTGRLNKNFSFKLAFLDRFGFETYEDIFTEDFNDFVTSCENSRINQTGAILVTPDIGEYNAVCTQINVVYDIENTTNGCFVNVDFMESPDFDQETPTYQRTTSIEDVYKQYKELEVIAAQEDIHEPNLFESLDDLTNTIRQVDSSITNIQNDIDRVDRQIEDFNAALESVSRPRSVWVRRRINSINANLLQTRRNTMRLGKTIVEEVIDSPRLLVDIAESCGITVLELLGLNPSLSGSPYVLKGTKVLKPKDKRRPLVDAKDL